MASALIGAGSTAVLGIASAAQAQTALYWVGTAGSATNGYAGTSDWETAANWSTIHSGATTLSMPPAPNGNTDATAGPGAGAQADSTQVSTTTPEQNSGPTHVINGGLNNPAILSGTESVTYNSGRLYLGYSDSGANSGKLIIQDSASLAISTATIVTAGQVVGATGQIFQTGGSFTGGSSRQQIGLNGTGLFDYSAGTVALQGLSFGGETSTSGSGTLNIHGNQGTSTFTIAGGTFGIQMAQGPNSAAAYNATFDGNGNGVKVITVLNSRAGIVKLAQGAGSTTNFSLTLAAAPTVTAGVPQNIDLINLTATSGSGNSLDTVMGTFTGLPEGSLVTANFGGNAYSWNITYVGKFDGSNLASGVGNDIGLIGNSVSAVPEPVGAGLLGLAGIGLLRRRRA